MMAWGKKASHEVEDENTHVVVITSGLSVPFSPIDSVTAIASQDAGFGGHDLDGIFRKVKNKLRQQCLDLAGDAVINCHFSERSAVSKGLVATQVIEIWAYGTVVKLDR